MKIYITRSTEICLRQMIFTPFNENNENVPPKFPQHECCSFCAKSCSCSSECTPISLPSYDESKLDEEVPIRSVTEEDKKLVKEMILDFYEQQCANIPLLAPGEILTGVSELLITDVLEKLPFVDSVFYVSAKLNMENVKFAREIATFVREVFIDDYPENLFEDLVEVEETDELGVFENKTDSSYFSFFSLTLYNSNSSLVDVDI